MTATRAIVHSPEQPGTAVAAPSAQRAMRLLRPIAEPADVIAAQEETRTLVTTALKKGRDYGTVPGVDKPTLLKPGAERVALAFGCQVRFSVEEREIDHDRKVEWVKRKKEWSGTRGQRQFKWIEERGISFGLYRYVMRCDLVDRSTDAVVGSCLGACSTLESKYIDRPRDSENTALKMAEKRALVGAVLVTFGLSEQFTQDVEDVADAIVETPEPEQAPQLTRESEFPFGKFQGKKIADLPDEFLAWSIEAGRKFGPHTDAWQAALKAEIYHRAESKKGKPVVREDPYAEDRGEAHEPETVPSVESEGELALGGTTKKPTRRNALAEGQ